MSFYTVMTTDKGYLINTQLIIKDIFISYFIRVFWLANHVVTSYITNIYIMMFIHTKLLIVIHLIRRDLILPPYDG